MFDKRWEIATNDDGTFAPLADGGGRGNGDRVDRGSPKSWNKMIRQSESPARALAIWDVLAAEALDGNMAAQKLYWERMLGRVEAVDEASAGGGADWMENEMLKADNAQLTSTVMQLRKDLDELRSALNESSFGDDSFT